MNTAEQGEHEGREQEGRERILHRDDKRHPRHATPMEGMEKRPAYGPRKPLREVRREHALERTGT